ncbi:MAG: hypothetical protein U0103_21420 [Candidatus Obscuribacterales bacterium]
MRKSYKILIATVPFIAAGFVLSALTYPKIVEDKDKSNELAQKDQQYQQLQAKLQQRVKAEQEKRTLETDIETLRGAVPKSPELDLAMIDLEKMCSESDLHLLGVEVPTQEQMHKISSSEQEIKELLGESTVGLGTKTLQRGNAKGNTADGDKASNGATDSGLKRLIKQVYVTGDYNGMVNLMRRLEGYQRTVGVEQISIAINTKGANETNESNEHSAAQERAQKMGLTKPVMAFLLTLYYLP